MRSDRPTKEIAAAIARQTGIGRKNPEPGNTYWGSGEMKRMLIRTGGGVKEKVGEKSVGWTTGAGWRMEKEKGNQKGKEILAPRKGSKSGGRAGHMFRGTREESERDEEQGV